MVVFLRNLKRKHDLDSFIVNFGGRGNIVYKKVEPEGDSLIDFWISRLEDVINWLKSLKRMGALSLSSPVAQLTLVSNVLEPSASILIPARSRSHSIAPTASLVSSKVSLKISSKAQR